jgi:hypothetical protein
MVGGDTNHPYMAHVAAPSSFFILNQEEEWVKFNKCVIIKTKAVNRE